MNLKNDYVTIRMRDGGIMAQMQRTKIFDLKIDMINRIWFRNCIGGIEETEEKKEEALNKIKSAVTEEDKRRVTIEDFAVSYPESLAFVRNFYVGAKEKINEHYRISEYRSLGFTNELEYKDYLREKQRKQLESQIVLLVVYGPILSQYQTDEEVNRVLQDLGIDLVTFGRVINYYGVATSQKTNAIKGLDENYSDNISERIISDFLKSRSTMKEICSKYNIGRGLFRTYVNMYVEAHPGSAEEIKNLLQQNSDKRYSYLNDLVNKVANYSTNGIVVDSTKIPFTMLDYICLTDTNIDDLFKWINMTKEFRTKEELITRSKVVKFYQGHRRLGQHVYSVDTVLQQKNVFIINGVRYEPSSEDIEEIFELFKENRIPQMNILIQIALSRKAKGIPILPLKTIEKEKNEELEQHRKVI